MIDAANGSTDTYIRASTTGNTTAGFVSKNSGHTYFAGVYYNSGDSYQIYDMTNGAARVTVNSNGRVGIGTTGPDATLDVSGDIAFGSNSGLISTYYTYTSGAYNLCTYIAGAGGSQFLVMINGHGGVTSTQTAVYSVSVHYDGTYYTATQISGPTAFSFDVSGGYLRITSGSYNWFYTVTILRNDF
jgi:hypothetical protein